MTNATGEVKGEARRYYNIWQQEKTADVYIYGYITSYPTEKSDVSAYDLAQDIAGLDVDTINVYINSPGGQVSEGLAIFTALSRHPAKVVTHCDGFACSAASVIFMAGDERLMSSVGLMMIHEASCWASGNATVLKKAAEDLAKITESAAAAYKGRVNVSDDELAELLAAETWLNANDAVAKGFATGIEDWQEMSGTEMSVQGRIAELVQRGLDKGAPKQTDMAMICREISEMKSLLKGLRDRPEGTPKPAPQNTGRGFFNFKKNEEE